MAVTAPPTVDALPAAPDPNDRATFNTRAYPWANAQATFRSQVVALATNLYNNALEVVDLAASALGYRDAASGYATSASNSATAAATQAANAATSAAQAAAIMQLYLGARATDPTGALVDGNWYINSVSGFIRGYTVAGGWVQGISVVAGVTSFNGQTGAVTYTPPTVLWKTYDIRADLRSLTPNSGDLAVVESLGLFVYVAGSTEPDDDESCFATSAGRWLLQAAAWDFIDAAISELRDAADLQALAPCSISSVSTAGSAQFNVSVIGALPGDSVSITPPGTLGVGGSTYGYVSAADVVTVVITNASSSSLGINGTLLTTPWTINVKRSA